MAHDTTVTYISEVECAKRAVAILAQDFPGVKFSRKTSKYSGGSSIRIGWTNGPTVKQVEARIGHMHGSTFDGMTDMKSHHDSEEITLKAGEIVIERVRYANDYMNTGRTLTAEAYELALTACLRDRFQAITYRGWTEAKPGSKVIAQPSAYDPNGFDIVDENGQHDGDSMAVARAWLEAHDLRDMANPVKIDASFE